MEKKEDTIYRGRANVVIYSNNEIDVRMPESHPELQAERICESRRGTLALTKGVKAPKYTLRISVPSSSPDPAADLRDEAERLLRSIDNSTHRKRRPPANRVLSNENGVEIRVSSGRLIIGIDTPLDTSANLIYKFNTQIINSVIKCLVLQKAVISKLFHAQATSSSK